MVRRSVELTAAAAGLVILSPILLALALAVKLDSPGPVFHRGERVGLGGRKFRIFKFRTMVVGADAIGPAVTTRDDARVTRVGGFLRRTKLDELPQLINVLRGEMSFVGPRPESPRYVALYTNEQRRVLDVRPGITSPASVAFADEEEYIDPQRADHVYTSRVMPAKLAIELDYLESRSALTDLLVVLRTIAYVTRGGPRRRRIVVLIRRWVPWGVIDALCVVVAFYIAYLLRFVENPVVALRANLAPVTSAVAPAALVFVLSNHLYRLNSRVWRYATAADVLPIMASAITSTLVVVAGDIVLARGHQRALPIGVVLLGGVISCGGFVVARYRWRLLLTLVSSRRAQRGVQAKRVLVFGAGDTGQLVAWRLLTHRGEERYEVVGFLDDNPEKLGMKVHGLNVLGSRDDLVAIVDELDVDLIILAMSHVAGDDVRDILAIAERTPAQVKIAPALNEWMQGRSPILREVQVQDLLGREPVMLDRAGCARVLTKRRVLVTGAAGSIGSELCRQILVFAPAELVVLDNNESGLYDLDLELRAMQPDSKLEVVVADVTDAAKVTMVFAEARPEVIFHVAAYKHVPLMERYPEEAFRVNVLGTRAVLDAARSMAADHFVLVSSDKAVNPTSVMGATKRIAEMLVLHDAKRGVRPLCTAVRFGNVLGSRGSVIPTFARQIEMGGPVTVTDPEMTRYFMEISEAASLIIQAAALTTGGDLFILDMGHRIKVDDLARKMIRMRGLRPDVDIPIVYTGPRPGEKLEEELIYAAEEKAATAHPNIFRVTGQRSVDERWLHRWLSLAESLMATGDRERLAEQILQLAAGSATSRRSFAVGSEP